MALEYFSMSEIVIPGSEDAAKKLIASEIDFRILIVASAYYDDVYSLFSDILGDPSIRLRRKLEPSAAYYSQFEAAYGAFFTFACAVLYRWAGDSLNRRREKLELNAAKERIDLVLWLVNERGVDEKMATTMVNQCLDAIAKRSENDSAILKIKALAETADKTPRGQHVGITLKHLGESVARETGNFTIGPEDEIL